MTMAATASTAMTPCVRDALTFLRQLPPVSGQHGRDLCLDSRGVRAGDIFLGVPGGKSDGRQFLADAIGRGAAAALVDADGWDGIAQMIPVQPVKGLRDNLGALAAA
jgi:UDP-N-acetylmuramyl tripeptide synthase